MKRISTVLLLLVILLSACSVQERKSELKLNLQEEQLMLFENKEAGIKLLGQKQDSSDMIGPIAVHIGEASRLFQWENVSNETYYPELHLIDLDNDGEQELVIFLTLGYGTGIQESQVHVLRKDYTEIPFPSLIEDAKIKIQDSATQGEGQRVYEITVGEKTEKFTFDETDAVEWFDRVAVGNSVAYRMADNEIVAVLSAQVSPGEVLGDLEIPYKLVNGEFIEQAVRFVAFK